MQSTINDLFATKFEIISILTINNGIDAYVTISPLKYTYVVPKITEQTQDAVTKGTK